MSSWPRISSYIAVAAGLALLAACGGGAFRPNQPYAPPQPMIRVQSIQPYVPLPGQPRAVIIALHSFGDYSAAFTDFSAWAHSQQIAVYAYDQPGFGTQQQNGAWPGDDALVTRLTQVFREVRHAHPQVPIYLLGESMGASVIILTLATYPQLDAAGAILVGPAVRAGLRTRDAKSFGIGLLSAIRPQKKYDTSTRAGPSLADAATQRFRQDPLAMQNVRADTYEASLKLADSASLAAERITHPVLILYGQYDQTVKPESVCALRKSIKGPLKMLTYPLAPHLLLQMPEPSEVYKDIELWIRGNGTFMETTPAVKLLIDNSRAICGAAEGLKSRFPD